MEIGVLALQGAIREHLAALERCGVAARTVKKALELEGLAGLVIPGGESTTVGKLLVRYDLLDPLKEKATAGMAIFGTCTGLILMAREIEGRDQPRLGLLDITVRRNAFGRQVDSFEADLEVPTLGSEHFRAIFIRGPEVVRTGNGVDVLARHEDHVVLVRQGRFLAAAFHPELTRDDRLHRYFLAMCGSEGNG